METIKNVLVGVLGITVICAVLFVIVQGFGFIWNVASQ